MLQKKSSQIVVPSVLYQIYVRNHLEHAVFKTKYGYMD